MAVKTLQITQTGSAVQISATSIKARWIYFTNTGAAGASLGDASVSSTQGVQLAATGSAGNAWNPPAPMGSTDAAYHDLSQWWTKGTSSQVLSVTYDSVNA